MKANTREDELENLVGNIGQTFLGMTVNCARCHDHKFDPLRQTEYFQMAAAVGGLVPQRARAAAARRRQRQLGPGRIAGGGGQIDRGFVWPQLLGADGET